MNEHKKKRGMLNPKWGFLIGMTIVATSIVLAVLIYWSLHS